MRHISLLSLSPLLHPPSPLWSEQLLRKYLELLALPVKDISCIVAHCRFAQRVQRGTNACQPGGVDGRKRKREESERGRDRSVEEPPCRRFQLTWRSAIHGDATKNIWNTCTVDSFVAAIVSDRDGYNCRICARGYIVYVHRLIRIYRQAAFENFISTSIDNHRSIIVDERPAVPSATVIVFTTDCK